MSERRWEERLRRFVASAELVTHVGERDEDHAFPLLNADETGEASIERHRRGERPRGRFIGVKTWRGDLPHRAVGRLVEEHSCHPSPSFWERRVVRAPHERALLS